MKNFKSFIQDEDTWNKVLITVDQINEDVWHKIERSPRYDSTKDNFKDAYSEIKPDPGLHAHIWNYTVNSKRLNTKLFKGHELDDEQRNHVEALDRIMAHHTTPNDVIVHSGLGFTPEHMPVHPTGKIRIQTPAYLSTSLSRSTAYSFANEPKDSEHTYFRVHVGEGKVKWVKPTPEQDAHFNKVFMRHEVGDEFLGYDHPKVRAAQEEFKKSLGHVPNASYLHSFGRFPHKHMLTIHVPAGSHGFYADPHSKHDGEHEVILPRNSKILIHPKPRLLRGRGDGILAVNWRGHLVHDGFYPTRHDNEEPKQLSMDF